MVDIGWTHPSLPTILDTIPKDVKSLIDVGCGRGIIGAMCRIYRDASRLVGIEVYQPYVKFLKDMNFYDEVHSLDLQKTPLPYKDKEFNVATCIEVIEHMTKDKGIELLDELERIAKAVPIARSSIPVLVEPSLPPRHELPERAHPSTLDIRPDP